MCARQSPTWARGKVLSKLLYLASAAFLVCAVVRLAEDQVSFSHTGIEKGLYSPVGTVKPHGRGGRGNSDRSISGKSA